MHAHTHTYIHSLQPMAGWTGLNLRLTCCYGNCSSFCFSVCWWWWGRGRGNPSLCCGREVRDALGPSSLGWVPVPTEAVLRGSSPFHLPHACTIPRTSGSEETGRMNLAPAPRRTHLMGRNSPLSSKYLIEMKKTPWLTVSLKIKRHFFSLLHLISAFVPPSPPPSRQMYVFPEAQNLFLTNLIFFNYKSNTYSGFSIKKTLEQFIWI